MLARLIFTTTIAASLTLPAFAQEQLMRQRLLAGQENSVQSSITIVLPLDDAKDEAVQHEEALRKLYNISAGSCAALMDTVADSCEMASITTNVRSDDNGVRIGRISATAQIMMRVTFKKALSSTPQ